MLPPDSPAAPISPLQQVLLGFLIVLGTLCMVLGFAWFWIMPTSWFITPEDAQRNTQIAQDFHMATGQAGSAKNLTRPNAKELEAKRAYIQQQYEAVEADREYWKAMYHRTPVWLKIAGAICYGIGLVIALGNRQQ
jgi:hypothetical protein